MNYTKKEREEYNEYRTSVCEKLGINKTQYNRLRQYQNKMHQLDENNCNGDITEEEYTREINLVYGNIENYLLKINKGLSFFHQSDPRGVSLYIDTKTIQRNNYTTANCIY